MRPASKLERHEHTSVVSDDWKCLFRPSAQLGDRNRAQVEISLGSHASSGSQQRKNTNFRPGCLALQACGTYSFPHHSLRTIAESAQSTDQEGSTDLRRLTGRALLACSREVAALSAAGLWCIIGVFWSGANYYECGEGFLKWMTAARLADDEISEWLYACACTLWMVGLASVLRRMVRRFAPGPTERVQAAVSASSAKESLQQRSRYDRFIG